MTEAELELVRWKCRAFAAEIVVEAVWKATGREPSVFRQSLLATANHAAQSYGQIALSGYPPELSDMLAGEFQDAFQALIERLRKLP